VDMTKINVLKETNAAVYRFVY